MKRPFFSVVMATYGRSRHIKPSILSVLQQDYNAFELIVVGDNCTDDTEAVVEGFNEAKIRWMNLPSRCGSQSAPNNAGIKAANGDVIAYIGHDDIWEPDHLTSLATLFESNPSLDFAVGGLIFHLPNGIPGSLVTGIFADDKAKHNNFFPPSSIAHKKSVCEKIGLWHMPLDIKAPVDCDFLLRAAAADLRFASTGKISVHKFAAGHRYLSYLMHESQEQIDMLALMKHADHEQQITDIVEKAKLLGTYMVHNYTDFEKFAPGELARTNQCQKGVLQRPATLPAYGAVMRHKKGSYALDWQGAPKDGIRWTARNPRPKMLVPYTGGMEVICTFRTYHKDRAALHRMVFLCNGREIIAEGRDLKFNNNLWSVEFSVQLMLHPTEMSVLQFLLDETQAPTPKRGGIGIGTPVIVPTTQTSGRNLATLRLSLIKRYVDFVDTRLKPFAESWKRRRS